MRNFVKKHKTDIITVAAGLTVGAVAGIYVVRNVQYYTGPRYILDNVDIHNNTEHDFNIGFGPGKKYKVEYIITMAEEAK